MRFLLSPEIMDIKSYSFKSSLVLQAVQWMSKAYTNITFGKMFSEGTEYGLHLLNPQICSL